MGLKALPDVIDVELHQKQQLRKIKMLFLQLRALLRYSRYPDHALKMH